MLIFTRPPLTPIVYVTACSLLLPVPTTWANTAPEADPFEAGAVSTEVPSPDGSEWAAPAPPPPPPPPSPSSDEFDRPGSYGRERPAPAPHAAEPEEQNTGKQVMTGGIVLLSLAAGSAGLSYYTYDTRRKTEVSLAAVEQGNVGLVAAGLPSQDTSDLEQKIKLHRGLSAGFGIGAAVLLVTGGVLFLVGNSRRKRQAQPITWMPRLSGIEVSF